MSTKERHTGNDATYPKNEPVVAPVVYLVNHISGHGHLDMYARLYSRAFLQAGYRVVLLSEGAGAVAEHLRDEQAALAPYFRWMNPKAADNTTPAQPPSIEEESTKAAPLSRRLARIWQREGAHGLLLRVKLNGQRLVDFGIYYMKIAASFCLSHARRLASKFISLRPGYPSFRNLSADVEAASHSLGWSPSLVFFLYLDMISESSQSCRAIAKAPWPWSGILFHPQLMTRHALERYIESPTCAGLAFLNPMHVSVYGERDPTRHFVALPDITEARLPSQSPKIVKSLKEKARGRPVVLLSGSLSPHKGVMPFLELVSIADPEEFCFALVGEIFWKSFGAHEGALRDFVESPPENCFTHAGYLDRDEDVNALIECADILYSSYKDFPNSSNSLTKAAIFNKPILVSTGHLMAQRVAEYRLGDSIVYNDVSGALVALRRLRDRSPSSFGFEDYKRGHSLEALVGSLRSAASVWATQPENNSMSSPARSSKV